MGHKDPPLPPPLNIGVPFGFWGPPLEFEGPSRTLRALQDHGDPPSQMRRPPPFPPPQDLGDPPPTDSESPQELWGPPQMLGSHLDFETPPPPTLGPSWTTCPPPQEIGSYLDLEAPPQIWDPPPLDSGAPPDHTDILPPPSKYWGSIGILMTPPPSRSTDLRPPPQLKPRTPWGGGGAAMTPPPFCTRL